MDSTNGVVWMRSVDACGEMLRVGVYSAAVHHTEKLCSPDQRVVKLGVDTIAKPQKAPNKE